jgi:hypothetical protein
MFNNLGMRGVVGITTLPYILRPAPLFRRPVLTRRPVACGAASIGGSGNDIINIGGLVGPPGPEGPQGIQGIQGPAGDASPVAVTVVESDYAIQDTDYFIGVITSAEYTITLPDPVEGTVYVVKDISGNAATNNITINNTSPIDGAATAVISTDYGSLTFVFVANAWSII